ncbi:MAG: hypothetical protein JWO62_2577, partial [Acidimicrobiaceae bacterium]|nr:hypothetical protein [Acidimicrobiaceae bacterium]
MPLFTVGEVLTSALANVLAMTPKAEAANYTASDGDFVIMTGGHVVTLPAPTNQSAVLIYADDANTANGFTAAGAAIVKGLGLGAGTAAGTLVPLGVQGAFCLAEADGTNWRITAGNSDSGWINPANGSYSNSWVNGSGSAIPFGWRVQGNKVLL